MSVVFKYSVYIKLFDYLISFLSLSYMIQKNVQNFRRIQRCSKVKKKVQEFKKVQRCLKI